MENETTILSERETEILSLLAKGKNMQYIATVLPLKHATVRNHVANIQAKLGTDNVLHSAMYAQFHGIINVHFDVHVKPKENPKDKFNGRE